MSDEETKQVTLIDVQKKRWDDDCMCYYQDEQGEIYCGGSNLPHLGYSANRTVEDIGNIFIMKSRYLSRSRQNFEDGKFIYR